MGKILFSREKQEITFISDLGETKTFECRSDFVQGYNESGQPRASLPLGTYYVSAEEPPAEDCTEFGTFYITTGDPRGRDIHGGGTGLEEPKADRQGWIPTLGCLRMQNIDGQELSRLIIEDGNEVELEVTE